MKKYMNEKDRAIEAETLGFARMVAHIADLELDTKIPILPSQFEQFLIAPVAQVIIVPSTLANGHNRRKVEDAMCMSCCDAIMVQIVPQVGGRKIMFEIGRDGLVPVWFSEYSSRIVDGDLFFLPSIDPTSAPLFKLTKKGLMSSNDFDGMRFDGW
jgi:hypothetical protein